MPNLPPHLIDYYMDNPTIHKAIRASEKANYSYENMMLFIVHCLVKENEELKQKLLECYGGDHA